MTRFPEFTFFLLASLLCGSVFGCGDVKPAAPAKCMKAGDQCQLPSGPLGVCSTVDCKEGQPPPCLVCMSQH